MSDEEVPYGDDSLEPIEVLRLSIDTGGTLHPHAIGQLVSAMTTLSDWSLTLATGQPQRFAETRPATDVTVRFPTPRDIELAEELYYLRRFPIRPFAAFIRAYNRPADPAVQAGDPVIVTLRYTNPVELAAGVAEVAEAAHKAAGILTAIAHPIRSWKASGARLDAEIAQGREASANADRAQLAAVRDVATMPPIPLGALRAIEERYPEIAPMVGADHLLLLENVRAVAVQGAIEQGVDEQLAITATDDARVLTAIAQTVEAGVEISSGTDWWAPPR